MAILEREPMKDNIKEALLSLWVGKSNQRNHFHLDWMELEAREQGTEETNNPSFQHVLITTTCRHVLTFCMLVTLACPFPPKDSGLLFPSSQNFSSDLQQSKDCRHPQKFNNALMSTTVHPPTICEYDVGGEGNLFIAPELIIEEPVMDLDPFMPTIPIMSCGEELISLEELKVRDFESIQSDQLLSEVYYDCEEDLIEKAVFKTSSSENVDVKVPVTCTEGNQIPEDQILADLHSPNSVSTGNLNSMDWFQGAATMKPNFLDFHGMDFGTVYGMRRAFSEGDIETLGSNGKASLILSPLEQPLMATICSSEQRKEKLTRYRNKKTKRNFGRKIKYACRKALADSQPRIRGRFAKTEEPEHVKKQ